MEKWNRDDWPGYNGAPEPDQTSCAVFTSCGLLMESCHTVDLRPLCVTEELRIIPDWWKVTNILHCRRSKTIVKFRFVNNNRFCVVSCRRPELRAVTQNLCKCTIKAVSLPNTKENDSQPYLEAQVLQHGRLFLLIGSDVSSCEFFMPWENWI